MENRTRVSAGHLPDRAGSVQGNHGLFQNPLLTVLFYYETAGAWDTVSLIRPIEEFYNSHFEEPEFSTLAISR